MTVFAIIIKIIAVILLMFFDLAAFSFGLFCLAGGGEHDSITDCMIMGGNIACIFVAVCIGNAAFVEIQ